MGVLQFLEDNLVWYSRIMSYNVQLQQQMGELKTTSNSRKERQNQVMESPSTYIPGWLVLHVGLVEYPENPMGIWIITWSLCLQN